MERIRQVFKKHKGYCKAKDLRENGIHTRDIAKAIDTGTIEKIKTGLYKLINYPWDEHSSFIDVSMAKKSAVICLVSALAYHELSTINPERISIAVPMNTDKVEIIYPPVSLYYFPDTLYKLGIEKMRTKNGSFKIYNAEKTICDMFRYRNKLGEDIALEGLRNYLKKRDANINKLWDYAIKCRVKTIVHPYIKAMVV